MRGGGQPGGPGGGVVQAEGEGVQDRVHVLFHGYPPQRPHGHHKEGEEAGETDYRGIVGRGGDQL